MSRVIAVSKNKKNTEGKLSKLNILIINKILKNKDIISLFLADNLDFKRTKKTNKKNRTINMAIDKYEGDVKVIRRIIEARGIKNSQLTVIILGDELRFLVI